MSLSLHDFFPCFVSGVRGLCLVGTHVQQRLPRVHQGPAQLSVFLQPSVSSHGLSRLHHKGGTRRVSLAVQTLRCTSCRSHRRSVSPPPGSLHDLPLRRELSVEEPADLRRRCTAAISLFSFIFFNLLQWHRKPGSDTDVCSLFAFSPTSIASCCSSCCAGWRSRAEEEPRRTIRSAGDSLTSIDS